MSGPFKYVDEYKEYKAEDGTLAELAGRLFSFTTGYSDLLISHMAWLDTRVIEEVMKRPHPWIDIIGYASKLGGSEDNQKLSERRAKAVKNYIVEGLKRRGRSPEGLITPQPSQGEFGKGYVTTNPRDDDEYWRAVDVIVYGVIPPSVNILPPINIDINTPLPVSDWKIAPGASESGGVAVVTFTEGTFIFENLTNGKKYKANYAGGGGSVGIPVSITVSTESMWGVGSRILALKSLRRIEDLISGPSLMIVGSAVSFPLYVLNRLFGLNIPSGGYVIFIILGSTVTPSSRGPADWIRIIDAIIKRKQAAGVALMAGIQAGADLSVAGVQVFYHSYYET